MSEVVHYPALAGWLRDLIRGAGHASPHEFAQKHCPRLWPSINRWTKGTYAPRRKADEPALRVVLEKLGKTGDECEALLRDAEARNLFVPVDPPSVEVQAADPQAAPRDGEPRRALAVVELDESGAPTGRVFHVIRSAAEFKAAGAARGFSTWTGSRRRTRKMPTAA